MLKLLLLVFSLLSWELFGSQQKNQLPINIEADSEGGLDQAEARTSFVKAREAFEDLVPLYRQKLAEKGINLSDRIVQDLLQHDYIFFTRQARISLFDPREDAQSHLLQIEKWSADHEIDNKGGNSELFVRLWRTAEQKLKTTGSCSVDRATMLCALSAFLKDPYVDKPPYIVLEQINEDPAGGAQPRFIEDIAIERITEYFRKHPEVESVASEVNPVFKRAQAYIRDQLAQHGCTTPIGQEALFEKVLPQLRISREGISDEMARLCWQVMLEAYGVDYISRITKELALLVDIQRAKDTGSQKTGDKLVAQGKACWNNGTLEACTQKIPVYDKLLIAADYFHGVALRLVNNRVFNDSWSFVPIIRYIMQNSELSCLFDPCSWKRHMDIAVVLDMQHAMKQFCPRGSSIYLLQLRRDYVQRMKDKELKMKQERDADQRSMFEVQEFNARKTYERGFLGQLCSIIRKEEEALQDLENRAVRMGLLAKKKRYERTDHAYRWLRSAKSLFPLFIMNRRNAEVKQEILARRDMEQEYVDNETSMVDEEVPVIPLEFSEEQRRVAEETSMLEEDKRARNLAVRDARLNRRQQRRDDQKEAEEWNRVCNYARDINRDIEEFYHQKCLARYDERKKEQSALEASQRYERAVCLANVNERKMQEQQEQEKPQLLNNYWRHWRQFVQSRQSYRAQNQGAVRTTFPASNVSQGRWRHNPYAQIGRSLVVQELGVENYRSPLALAFGKTPAAQHKL